jgi:hypothetical protein
VTITTRESERSLETSPPAPFSWAPLVTPKIKNGHVPERRKESSPGRAGLISVGVPLSAENAECDWPNKTKAENHATIRWNATYSSVATWTYSRKALPLLVQSLGGSCHTINMWRVSDRPLGENRHSSSLTTKRKGPNNANERDRQKIPLQPVLVTDSKLPI